MPFTIVGIGELLWDVDTVFLGRTVRTPGGAPFNFVTHCRNLGQLGVPVSRVGRDEDGEDLLREVVARGLPTKWIPRDPDHATGMVRIRRDEVGQPAYEILENRAWDHLTWDDTLASLANSADAVCFGTLGQRHAPARSTIRKFLACCRGRIILDLNLRPPHDATPLLMESLALAQVLKFNDAECAELSRRRNRDHVGETDFVLQLFREYESLEVIIVTAGAAGCRIYPRESAKPISIPAEPLQAGDLVDPVGAGDAFTAAWIVNHLQGRDLLEAGRRANQYAGEVCRHHGGAPILALLE